MNVSAFLKSCSSNDSEDIFPRDYELTNEMRWLDGTPEPGGLESEQELGVGDNREPPAQPS